MFPPSPATPETQTCVVRPLVDPFRRWLQAEVFSFSLPFVFLDAHYTLLYTCTAITGVPDYILQNGTFGCGRFGQLCVWPLEFDALTTQVCGRGPFL